MKARVWTAIIVAVLLVGAVGATTRPSFAGRAVVPFAPASSPMATPGTLTASRPVFAVGDTVTTTDTVNLRSGPSTSDSAVTTLNTGDTLTIVSGPVQANNYSWYQMRTVDGTTGWVASDFLQRAAPVFAVGDTVVSTHGGDLRNAPSTSGYPVGAVTEDDLLTILAGPVQGDNNVWYQVRTSYDTTGWIVADSLPGTSVTIEAGDLFFKPKVFDIPADIEVTLTIKNVGALPHDFNIDQLNVHSAVIQPGKATRVKITALAGAYEYYCNQPGHRAAGMVGTLRVRGSAATDILLASPVTGTPAPRSAASPTITFPGGATPNAGMRTSETPTPAPWATAEAQVRRTANAQCSDKLRALTLAVAALSQAPPVNTFSAGRLAHNPGDQFVASISTGLDVLDFALYVEFQSPYSPAVQPWDFSVLFRDAADGSQHYWLTIDSYGRWKVEFEHEVAGQRQIDDVMAGTVTNLRTSQGAWNGLFLIAHGGQGFAFLNGRSIAEVNLAENQLAGDISLAVGREGNTERAGATTAYRNLGIWDLAPVEKTGGATGACLSLAPPETRAAARPTATAPPDARTYTITGLLELRGTNGTQYHILPDGRCEGLGEFNGDIHEGTPVEVAGSPIRVVGQPIGTSALQAGRVEASGCTFPFTVTVPKADLYVFSVGVLPLQGVSTYSFDELVAAHWTVTLVK